jgi:uridine phosphorylase
VLALRARCQHTSAMPYPNVEGKHEHPALFDPQDFLAYLRTQGGLHDQAVPESFILCYDRVLFDEIERLGGLRPVAHRGRRFFDVEELAGRVGIAGGFGIGAPAAAVVLEELAALGARRFVSIGLAGALSTDLAIGDVVVCADAVRDEGVSHHYLPPGHTIGASSSLTAALEAALTACGVPFVRGATWTIDTPYRETITEISHYRAAGVLTVEMEAAALFAVAAYRGVHVAAGFVVSDLLGGDEWHGQFHDARDPLRDLYRAALQTLNDREQ